MSRRELIRASLMVAGAIATALAYRLGFAFRSDYVGHYLAGYGATLVACTLAIAATPQEFRRQVGAWLLPGVVGICILLGTGLEATVFRIAIFDPVDFGNQSLGAVLAGLSLVPWSGGPRAPRPLLSGCCFWGMLCLVAGGYYALC